MKWNPTVSKYVLDKNKRLEFWVTSCLRLSNTCYQNTIKLNKGGTLAITF